jgi:hypothetical protein
MTKKKGKAGERSLRGHIDIIYVANTFIEVRGWVCNIDNTSAEPPLTLMVDGQAFGGFGLSQRDDLVQAGIADGIAAIDAVVPLTNQPPAAEYNVIIKDASGVTGQLFCPVERVSIFEPSGAFDYVDGRHVGGWVFDPAAVTEKPPELQLDGEIVARLTRAIERPDLSFDLGDSRRLFGFEAQMDEVRREVVRRRGSTLSGTTTVTLVSSGFALATAHIRLADEGAYLESTTTVVPSTRVHTSYMLDRLMALA